MKVIVAGGRDFTDYDLLIGFMAAAAIPRKATEIVSGAARGADSLGEQFAADFNIPTKLFPANWNKHGRAAGPIRNREMADYADALVAFWDGKSVGTKHMIDTMMKMEKPVWVCHY